MDWKIWGQKNIHNPVSGSLRGPFCVLLQPSTHFSRGQTSELSTSLSTSLSQCDNITAVYVTIDKIVWQYYFRQSDNARHRRDTWIQLWLWSVAASRSESWFLETPRVSHQSSCGHVSALYIICNNAPCDSDTCLITWYTTCNVRWSHPVVMILLVTVTVRVWHLSDNLIWYGGPSPLKGVENEFSASNVYFSVFVSSVFALFAASRK